MLSKPQYGWTDFSLGESCYGLSYITNIPLEWLDRAIFGLESLLPFEVRGQCEPGELVCAVDMTQCSICFKEGMHSRCTVVPINMLDFCKLLHADISACVDAWTNWNPVYQTTKEQLQARLDRLQMLIRVKENCFIL